jgi:DNA mismatch repair protein MutS2
MTMNLDRWETIQQELQGAVVIRRVRTAMDPTARSSYQFELSEIKYPILKVLRQRETFLRQQQLQKISPSDQAQRDKQLGELGEEIEEKENEIQAGLKRILYSHAKHMDVFLDHIAQLDVIFAKAAYGMLNGAEYHVTIGNDQFIDVPRFVHPLLTQSAVPVDLILRQNTKALVISGSNGGGKTTVLKSFGLASVLAKLGIPFITKSSGSELRIDFFDKILINIGDYQDLTNHQSTYTAQLTRYVDILEQVSTNKDQSFLVLLDELGSGTEEQAGGAIGQAVLEQLLEHDNCKIVATTHSPLLKTLSFVSDRIDCASVLLSRRNQRDQDNIAITNYQLPSFQLQYGCIGESNALGAASQILPQGVLERASKILYDNVQSTENTTIVNGGDFSSIAYMRALTESLEFKLICAEDYLVEAENRAEDSRSIQKAMISLASAYDDHLSRLEQRIENCFQTIKRGGGNDSLQLLGDTVAELRVVRAKIKTETELLREKGLQRIPFNLELTDGTVVVVACNDEECSKWNGMTGKVVSPPSYRDDKEPVTNGAVWVSLSSAFGGDDRPLSERVFLFQRHQLAIWDYASVWEDEKSLESAVARSIPEARERLNNILSTLSSSPSKEKKQAKSYSNFLSSRERKASKRQKKK